MDLREALYTTRAMRRLRPDPVPVEVIARILDAGIRAPSGGNVQDWRFVTVTDRAKVSAIGAHYRVSLATLFGGHYKEISESARSARAAGASDPRTAQVVRVLDSSQHLADHFDDVPLLIFGYSTNRDGGPSIWPALWSMCLAARGEGIGSTVTTVLGAFASAEVNAILGVPEGFHQHACLPLGYPTGRWDVAARKPASKVCFHDSWGEVAPWAPDGPLWPDSPDHRA